MPDEADKLDPYRAKRSADRTPEPFGGEAGEAAPGVAAVPEWQRPRLFVVQKHSARRLHYDFRLELGGVLLSWAVPKGPSFDPKQKRMAVEVEDHPVEYADFEGIIPEGNYGAGPVIVWDKGLWVAREDPEEGLRKGKLVFELRGYKLRGEWALVRTKAGRGGQKQKDWLLIKHRGDAWVGHDERLGEESILSGLTLEELEAGRSRAEEVRAELLRLSAPSRAVKASDVTVMLAETAEQPFSDPAWLYELKYDGYRLVAGRAGGEAHLYFRRGSESTLAFPEIARAVAALPYEGLVLDGEVVCLDEEGRPIFNRLQQRALLQRRGDIERAAVELPATYYAFDLLGFEDFDLRPLPLLERKRLLQRVLPRAGPIRYSDHVAEHGEALFAEVEGRGLEGVVAKKADSPYRGGRFRYWLKLRVERTGDFLVVGWTEPRGSRIGFRALHLAAWEGDRLVYVGRVGSGFSDPELQEVREQLEADARESPACSGGELPRGREHHWVEPRLVCEVRFMEWTQEGILRQPVFLRFRRDKPLRECVREGVAPAESTVPAPALASAPPAERKVPFSNLTKVFWPDQGYTKGDLIDFYRAVSPWLLRYLRDRLVVLTRYPDGVAGKSFFQKDAPGFVPDWVRTERIWSEHAQREIDYFVCDDVESVLYLANLGSIPLHVWSSRVRTLQWPDWTILDLDPKGAPFPDVVALALTIQRLCEELGLPCFPKTSGSTGLHVLIPLGGQCSYQQSRTLAELLARLVVAERPDIATVVRAPIQARGGRVYVDFLQNGHGRLLVSPLSVRPVPGARVSTMLSWDEVDPGLDPARFTLKTVPERLAALGDPMAPVLELKPDLPAALSRLSARLARLADR